MELIMAFVIMAVLALWALGIPIALIVIALNLSGIHKVMTAKVVEPVWDFDEQRKEAVFRREMVMGTEDIDIELVDKA